jgi:hypothetical protein
VIEPKIVKTVPKNKIKQLPSSFQALSETEKKEEWGKEYFIGQKLAQKFDLYRAVTAFKRAEILIPGFLKSRLHEIQYFIVLSYFLGEKYDDALSAFEESDLIHVDHQFKAYKDLLVILHECFRQTHHQEKAALTLGLLEKEDQKLSHILKVSHAINHYDRQELENVLSSSSMGQETQKLMNAYDSLKKSPAKAQAFNALLPGAGYLYLGQRQAALTAFLLNGLTTYGAYRCYKTGHLAIAILLTSIETGWYFGGITGAKESCKLYNERVYENKAQPIIQKHELHPIFNITHAF